ncbi:MAG: hypothetical protein KOO62_01530 [candidate division Zixibacteria bacterium]|nr:hypothetical protein [candidate division Zixibacteria bacterium]
MKCPECSYNAMSFGKCLVIFDPRRIRCRNCDAKLKLSHQWVSTFWVSIAVAFVLGTLHALLDNLFSSDNVAFSLVVWVAAALCYELVFWNFATYEVMVVEETSS